MNESGKNKCEISEETSVKTGGFFSQRNWKNVFFVMFTS